jgi:hypothetical protein
VIAASLSVLKIGTAQVLLINTGDGCVNGCVNC